jgi:methionine sulfoxide reductase heme-binding subunit
MNEALWYLGRGSGVVSLLLLTVVVALGIATRSGRPLPGLPRFAVATVHRTASLLAVVFLGLHITTLVLDPIAQLRLADVVLPFTGSYRPVWLGLGTLAADLIAALVVTSLLRQRMGARVWRVVHWAAYAAWPVALLHGVGTGTDAGTPWLLALTVGCVAAVLGALAWRVSPGFAERPGARPAARPGPPKPGVPRDLTVSLPTKAGAR